MIISEFYNFLLETISKSDVDFVKGRESIEGFRLEGAKNLVVLLANEMEKVNHDPNRLTKQHLDNVYKKAGPGTKKHIDNMKSSHGDYWYKPKNGFKFGGFLKGRAKHLRIGNDERMMQVKKKNGTYVYFVTTHGQKNSYKHIEDYVKQLDSKDDKSKKSTGSLSTKKVPEPKKDEPAPRTYQRVTPTPQATRSTKTGWKMKGMEKEKKPSAFQRLKNVLGMK